MAGSVSVVSDVSRLELLHQRIIRGGYAENPSEITLQKRQKP